MPSGSRCELPRHMRYAGLQSLSEAYDCEADEEDQADLWNPFDREELSEVLGNFSGTTAVASQISATLVHMHRDSKHDLVAPAAPADSLAPGTMQLLPLTVNSLLDHAARWHGQQAIVSRMVEGSIVRSTFKDLHIRSQLVALSLQQLGVRY